MAYMLDDVQRRMGPRPKDRSVYVSVLTHQMAKRGG
jgi:hypothetical protein